MRATAAPCAPATRQGVPPGTLQLARQAVAPAAARRPPPLRRLRRGVAAAAADDESEVAVFRFTLGNDAADALVPRVVGGVGAAALLLNHVLSGEAASEAQVRPAACACCTPLPLPAALSAVVPDERPAVLRASLRCPWLTPTNLPLQTRAEALGALLAAVAWVAPGVEARLKELQPGRGRQAAAASVPGAASVFALPPGAADGTKQVRRGG